MYEREEKKNGIKEKEKAKRDSKKERWIDRLHVSEKTFLVEINWNNLVRTQVRSYKSLETIIGTTDTPSSFTESCNPSSSLATCLRPPSIYLLMYFSFSHT